MDHSTVSVSYAEDTRDLFNGYSLANISWTRPQGEVDIDRNNYRVFLFSSFSFLTQTSSILHHIQSTY